MPSQFLISAEKSRKRGSTFNDHLHRWNPGCLRRKINRYSYSSSAKKTDATSVVMLEEEVEYQSKVGISPRTRPRPRSRSRSRPRHSTDGLAKRDDGDHGKKISVTKKTLETMENEADQLSYPTTLYRLGEALSNSPSVLFDHCHPIEEEESEIFKQGDSSQNLDDILQNSKMKQNWDRGNDGGQQLKRKLHQLVKQDGSLDLCIQNWDEAMEHLSTVLKLPQNYHQKEEEEEDNSKGYRFPCLKVSHKLKSSHSRKPVPFKAARNSIEHGSLQRTPKTTSGVLDYYYKIMKTMRRGKGVWNARSIWLQAKHVTPPREMHKTDNKKGQQEGEKEEEKIDPLVILRDQVFKVKIGEAEREARSKEIQERERIEKDILKREQEEEEARAKASSLLRPLNEEEESIVKKAMYGIGPSDDILARCNADSVQRRSMQCLQPGKWLNDEVIHYFYVMLANRDTELSEADVNHKRSHFFKSFFLTKLFDEGATNAYKYSNVKRWSKKVPGKDIFALDKIFCPCNLSNVHWACAVIFVQEKRIQFYDSMTGDGMYHMKGLLNYLKDEWRAKKEGELPDADKWRLVSCTRDTPVQENGFDCGVFTCMFADFLSMDKPLTFSQEHVAQCRKKIALSIMKGTAADYCVA